MKYFVCGDVGHKCAACPHMKQAVAAVAGASHSDTLNNETALQDSSELGDIRSDDSEKQAGVKNEGNEQMEGEVIDTQATEADI